MRAFVVEPTDLDLTTASEHGKVHWLYAQGERRPSMTSSRFGEDLLRRLASAEFDSQRDAIVVAGSVAVLAIAIAEIAKEYGRLNLLVFHSGKRRYVRVTTGGLDL